MPGEEQLELGLEDTTAEGAPAPVVDEPAAAAAVETPEPKEKVDPAVEALLESDKAGEVKEGEETEEPAFKPNLVFKAGIYNKETKDLEQKDYTIDPKFASIMKDPESEKLVRELHEKAYGLDSVKERYTETRGQLQQVSQVARELQGGIADLRKTYQSAVQTQNWHKLDKFFATLQIPQENILKYAMAKVQLNEMDPVQRNAIVGQLEAENRAEALAQQQSQTQQGTQTQAQQLRQLQIEVVMNKPEVSALAKAFDDRAGKPGAFLDAVRREGSLAWHSGQDIPPHQAVERVIENYGLKNGVSQPAAQTPQTTVPAPGKTALVQRTTQTIPNVQGRSTSPIKTPKPKSVDDLIKYRKENYGA